MTVFLLVLSPLMWLAAVLSLALTDLAWFLVAHARLRAMSRLVSTPCATSAASVVIPNWNGRDLLERYLPSVIAALAGHPENEIIVVDNGSVSYTHLEFESIDGSQWSNIKALQGLEWKGRLRKRVGPYRIIFRKFPDRGVVGISAILVKSKGTYR